MCYPKPGPRCSAHARNKYIQAKAAARRNRNFETNAAQREAEEEFYATPAGFRELERRIKVGDSPEANLEKLKHYKQVRSEQLRAIKSEDLGDIGHGNKPKKVNQVSKTSPKLPADETRREAWHCLNQAEYAAKEIQYINDSSEWIDTLNHEEIAAVRWITSNGFDEMGRAERGENQILQYGSTETDEETSERIARMTKTLDQALAKAPNKPRVVYRGWSSHSIPTELKERVEKGLYSTGKQYETAEEYENAQTKYFDKLKTEKEFSFNRPVSTTEDPGVGVRFMGGQYCPDIIFEIATSKGAPVAVASAWGASESEIVLPRDAKYRVKDIKKDFPIHVVNKREQTPETENVILIQLEEI